MLKNRPKLDLIKEETPIRVDPDIVHISENVLVSVGELEKIVDNFGKSFTEQITIQTVTDAVTTLMRIVGPMQQLSGKDKKYVVTQLLLYLVKASDSGQYDDLMDAILVNIIPILIDKLISVEEGKLVFNKQYIGCFSCFGGGRGTK